MEPTRFSCESEVGHTTWLEEVDSTNRFLSGRPSGADSAIVLSWHQTGGRGRLGREWVSARNKSLAMSVELWRETIPSEIGAEWVGSLSLLAAASLASAIRPHVQSTVSIKWPNDVLVGGKKVAGVLGEVAADGRVIVGVGLNVFLQADDLPGPYATSLSLHELSGPSAPASIVHSFLRALKDSVQGTASGLDAGKLSWVKEQVDTLGSRVRVEHSENVSRTGRAVDIAPSGALLVHFDDVDRVEEVMVGDVWHLRPIS